MRIIAGSVLVALLCVGTAAGGSHDAGGKLLFATGGDGVSDRLEIATVNPDGSGFRKLTHLAAPGFAPRWSRDGHKIIFLTEDSFTDERANWSIRRDGSRRQRLPGFAGDAPSPNGELVQIYDRIVNLKGRVVRHIRPGLRRDDYYADTPVWSPDGRFILIDVITETRSTEYVWTDVVPTSAGGRGRAITPRHNGSFQAAVSWSPDSTRLLLDVVRGNRDDWFTIAPDGSRRRFLRSVGTMSYRDHTWSPDSRRIAFVGARGGIYVISSSGGRAHRILATKSRGSEIASVYLDWSSRGEIVFTDVGGTYVVGVNGRGLRRLTTLRGAPYWSPNGRAVVMASSNEIYVVPRRGNARQLTQWLADMQPQWSPDGHSIAFVRGRGPFAEPRTVYVMPAGGGAARALGPGHSPRWSGDGESVAFVQSRPPPENDRIIVSDLGNGQTRPVADGYAPAWSVDGRIAFMRYRWRLEEGERGDWEIVGSSLVVARADGGDARIVVDTARGDDAGLLFAPRWAPDGRRIALRFSSESDSGIQVVDTVDGTVRTLNDEISPEAIEWSPDGSRLLARTFNELLLVDAASGDATVLRPEHKDDFSLEAARWSPDGASVAYIRCISDGADCDVYVMAAQPGVPSRRVTRTFGIEIGLDWAP